MPSDPTLYLYTSLTAGSSHIITGTSRIETILKANKIPFKAVDCATDDKARMIWQRRSKGKKLPGLVKFNDVIADLEQIEEWNEHGELEDEIESVIDIFGDVPVSGSVAEAQAAAAAIKSNTYTPQTAGGSSQARTASETRHISISEPSGRDERKKSESAGAVPSPLSIAMRQAGAEAAAKAGQKKAPSDPATAPPPVSKAKDAAAEVKSTSPATPATKLPESGEPATTTDAKTPDMLASEGAAKTSVDKINTPIETGEETSSKSTLEQTLDQQRKSSVPSRPSTLAKTTSVTDAKDDEEDDSEEDSEEDDDDDDESEDDKEEEEKPSTTGTAKKIVGATDRQEAKVTAGAEKTQDQAAKDGNKAGASVGD